VVRTVAVPPIQGARQKFTRMRLQVARHLFRRSSRHHMPARVSAFRPEINHPVRGLNHIQIVLDNQHRSSTVDQFAKSRQQLLNIVEMQARRRLVKNIENAGILLPREMRRQF